MVSRVIKIGVVPRDIFFAASYIASWSGTCFLETYSSYVCMTSEGALLLYAATDSKKVNI